MAARHDKRGRAGQIADRERPAPHERADVLARLDRAEESNEIGVAQIELSPQSHHVLRGGRMEDGAIDAERRHGDPPNRDVGMPGELLPGRLRRHDQPGSSTSRPARRGSEKAGLDDGVQLRVGEERRVVHRHDRRQPAENRLGVVRAVQDVGPDATSHAEQAGLFPAQPNRTTVEHARAGDDLEAERLVARPVGWLARDDDLGPRAG